MTTETSLDFHDDGENSPTTVERLNTEENDESENDTQSLLNSFTCLESPIQRQETDTLKVDFYQKCGTKIEPEP